MSIADPETVHEPLADSGDQCKHGEEAMEPTLTMGTEEAFLEKLSEHGGPHILLIGAWSQLAPILVPLVGISQINYSGGYFIASCINHPMWTARRFGCDITMPAVEFFPIVCMSSALGLVTWRLVRQRLFYIFLRQRMVLDLENDSSIKRLCVYI